MRYKLLLLLVISLFLVNEVDAITLTKDIPNFTWRENSDLDNAFDLDDYFSGEIIKYEYLEARSGSLNKFGVDIDSENIVSFSSDSDFRGVGHVVFNASNSSGSLLSNEVMLNVTQEEEFEIRSFSPNESSINVDFGGRQVFSVIVPERVRVKWFLDNQVVSEENSFAFSGSAVGAHTITAVASKGGRSLRKEWSVNVKQPEVIPEIVLPNITPPAQDEGEASCGNRKKDVGENCGNCPEDVKCSSNAVCQGGVCVPSVTQRGGGFSFTIVYLIGGIVLASGGIIIGVLFLLKKRKRGKVLRKGVEEARRDDLGLLRDYLRENMEKGFSLEELKRVVLDQGWREDQVSKVIEEISRVNIREERMEMDILKPLEDYVRQSLKSGYKREDIIVAARGQGWSEEQINEVFKRVEG